MLYSLLHLFLNVALGGYRLDIIVSCNIILFKKLDVLLILILVNVLSLYSLQLSNLELTILAHVLDYYIPFSITKREKIYSEFEVLLAQQRLFIGISKFCTVKNMSIE